MRLGARRTKLRSPLSQASIAAVVEDILPRRGDFPPIDYDELLGECAALGIRTHGQFRSLMLKYRRRLLAVDREPLAATELKIFRDEWGPAIVADRIRRQSWFNWAGSVRLALTWEFGDAYDEYSRRRDAT